MVASIFFIFERTLLSNLGLLNKKAVADCYKYDFVIYHNKAINWMAFLFILLITNFTICYYNAIRENSAEDRTIDASTLQFEMQMLLVYHILQVVFLRNFYDEQSTYRRIYVRSNWVWMMQVLIYPYVSLAYLAELNNNRLLESHRIWIPLDIMLTYLMNIYFWVHVKNQSIEI